MANSDLIELFIPLVSIFKNFSKKKHRAGTIGFLKTKEVVHYYIYLNNRVRNG